jgi:hypothetical protein
MSAANEPTSLTRLLSGAESRLRSLRARARAILIAAGLAIVGAISIAAIVLAGTTDYLVRTPDWFRGALLLAGLAGFLALVRRHVVPAWRFRPTLTQVALRLERSEAGREAGLEGLLTSGLELARELDDAKTAPSGVTRSLGAAVVERSAGAFREARAGGLLDLSRARRSVLTLATCSAGAIGLAAAIGPGATSTALTRLFAPWAGAQWPKRTEVVDATRLTVHPLGVAVPLRAVLTRSDRPEGEGRVSASYRIIGDGTAGTTRTVLLTGQRRAMSLPTADVNTPAISGELYERLIDADAAPASASASAPRELEYWFSTDDDETARRRVKLIEPPALVGASASITPPAYAMVTPANGGVAGTLAFAHGQRDLGTGSDARAVVSPVLAGSRIELTLSFNKPVKSPASGSPEAVRAFLASSFHDADLGEIERASLSGSAWTIVFTPHASVRLPVKASDDFGLSTRDDGAFSFDVSEDNPPSVTIVDPREDEAVLASASIEVTGEGRDDVGLASLRLTRQRATPPAGSASRAPELVEEREVFATLEGDGATGARRVIGTVDLSKLELKPGDEVWLHAIAQDAFASGDRRHDPVLSSPRKLRIIREDELIAQVRQELAGVRKAAMLLDGEQAELRKGVESGSVSGEDRRRQAGLTQRLAQQREVVDRLSQRAERNRLSDQSLSDLLNEVSSSFKNAGGPSERAAGRMDEAARANPSQPEADRAELKDEAKKSIEQDQDAVRDELARVAEMLDKGEDSWLVGRSLQRLLDQQKQLQAQTRRAGERTQGKRAEDLTPAEKSRLSQLADQERRLAEQARAAMDQLAQRSQQMKSVDAGQSQAMKQAEQRGRQQQLEQKMSEAARNVEKNQTSSAEAQQEEASAALEQMLQDLNNAQKNRDATLKRVLAGLIESLGRLIQDQESQIAALEKAAGNSLAGLDVPLAALNRNTLGVAEQARSDKVFAALAKLIERAGEAQGKAIAALRAEDAKTAQEQERESLRVLKQALAEAQREQEKQSKKDEDAKREQLRTIYREMLETQVALKGEVDPLVGKTLERRQRIALREVGERQEQVQKKLADVRTMSQDMQDAGVFQLAHDRLDRATGLAAKKIKSGIADASVARSQSSAILVLKALVEALDDRKKDEDDFQDDPGGSGQNGNGSQKPPLVPPLAELRLLRQLQQELADRTRGTDEAPDADELRRVGEDQKALFDRANDLIERLKKKNQGPGEAPQAAPGADDKPAANGEKE